MALIHTSFMSMAGKEKTEEKGSGEGGEKEAHKSYGHPGR